MVLKGKELDIAMVGVMDERSNGSTFKRSGPAAVKTGETANDIAELNSPMEVLSRIRAVAERMTDPVRQLRVPNRAGFVPVYEACQSSFIQDLYVHRNRPVIDVVRPQRSAPCALFVRNADDRAVEISYALVSVVVPGHGSSHSWLDSDEDRPALRSFVTVCTL